MESSRKLSSSYEDKIIRQIEEAPDKSRRSMFTPFEDDVIRKYYPKKGSQTIAKALERTARQIISRATAIGVKRYSE